MLPRMQLYNLNSGGEGNNGALEDISTRSLQTVRVGESAGKISSGTANAFVGYECGKLNSAGSFNAFVGYQAGANNTNASYSTMIGAFAGRENRSGSECVFVGFRAGELNNGGNACVAVGPYSMRENVSGTGSVAVGYRSAERTLDGDYNTMVGAEAGQDNRSGNFNTMVGFRSGRGAYQGSENTYVGSYAGHSNSYGSANCFIGFKSGEQLQLGDFNIAIGAYALQMSAFGSSNIAIGPYAGASSTSGSGNVLIGNQAAYYNKQGRNSVVIGTSAGMCNEGAENVILGYSTAANTKLQQSVIIGAYAAPYLQDGDGSVVIGHGAGKIIRSGTCNILIGPSADTLAESATHAIAIGAQNTYSSSYSISIGQNIENQRSSSVLLGFQLQSDADRSILVGNDINIQSVIFFKDPLNYVFKEAVKEDGYNKVGVSSIEYGYSNSWLTDFQGNPLLQATVSKPLTFISNSTTLKPNNQISPSTYDFRSNLGTRSYAYFQGSSLFLRNNADLSNVFQSSDVLGNIESGSNVSPTITSFAVPWSNYVHMHNCNIPVSYQRNDVVTNLLAIDTSSAQYPLTVAKRIQRPMAPFSSCNIYHPKAILSQISSSTPAIPLQQFSLSNISYETTDGIAPKYGAPSFVVTQPPQHGTLNKRIYSSNDTIYYTPNPLSAFSTNDTFLLRPIHQVSSLHGIPSAQDYEIPILVSMSNHPSQRIIYTPNDVLLPFHDEYTLSPTFFLAQPPLSPSTPLRVTSLDENIEVSFAGISYTSQQVAIMQTEQIDQYPDQRLPLLISNVQSTLAIAIQSNELDITSIHAPLIDTLITKSLILTDILVNQNVQQIQIDDLIQITHDACNLQPLLATTFQSQFYPLSNAIFQWYSQYDPFFQYTQTNDLLAQVSTLQNTYFDNQFHQYLLQTETLYHSIDSNLPAQTIYTLTSNTSNIMRTYDPTLFTSWPILEDAFTQSTILHTKYVTSPRLFLTIADTSNIRLQHTGSNTESIAPIEWTIRNEFNTENIINTPITIVKPASITSGIPSVVIQPISPSNLSQTYTLPSAYVDRVYCQTKPRYGVINTNVATSNLSTVTYYPFHPWAPQEDTVDLIIMREDQSSLLTWKLPTNSNQWIAQPRWVFPASNVYERIYEVETRTDSVNSNVIPIFDTIYEQYTITDTQNQTTTLPLQTNLFEITNYQPSIGIRTISSNVSLITLLDFTQTHTDPIGVITSSSNYSYHYERSNTMGALADVVDSFWTSPFETTCNLADPYRSENYVTQVNLHVIEDANLAQDKTIYQYTADQEVRQYVALDDPAYYFYTEVSPINYRGSPTYAYSNDVNAMGPLIYTTTSNIIARSNIQVKEPVAPVTHHLLHQVVATFHTDTTFLQSNVGLVQQFTQSNIDQNKLWIKTNNPSTTEFLLQGRNQSRTVSVDIIPSNRPISALQSLVTIPLVLGSNVYADLTETPIYSVDPSYIGFTPSHIAVQNLQYGAITLNGNVATLLPYSLGSQDVVRYVATSNIATDRLSISYVNLNDGQSSTPIQYSIQLNRTPYDPVQDFNMGISTQLLRSISEYGFTFAKNGLSPTNIQFQVRSISDPALTLSSSTFRLRDVMNQSVFIYVASSQMPADSITIRMDIYNTTDGSLLASSVDHTIRLYEAYVFPTPAPARIQMEQLGYDTHIRTTLQGAIWNDFTHLQSGSNNILQKLKFHINLDEDTYNNHGLLWNETIPQNQTASCAYSNLASNQVHYIPFVPGNLQNKTVHMYVQYQDRVSQEYIIDWKNYVATFPTSTFPATTRQRPTLTSTSFPKSQGLLADGYTWSPSTVEILPTTAQSITRTYSLASSTTALASRTYQLDPYPIASEIRWKSLTAQEKTFQVDEADSILLNPLLQYVSCNASLIPETIFTLETPPQFGLIQNIYTNRSVVQFTDTELWSRAIVYQHLGTSLQSDSFSVAVASSPYYVSSNSMTFTVQPRALPHVTCNITDFIYYPKVSDAIQGNNKFTCNLFVEDSTTHTGYMHVLSSNVSIAPTFTVRNVPTTGYTLPSSYFANGSNAPYPLIQMRFAPNATSTYHVNRLWTLDPMYEQMFTIPYEGRLNEFSAIANLSGSREDDQSLVYQIDPALDGSSNLPNRSVSYFLQFQPFQTFQADTVTAEGLGLTNFLRTFYYSVDFVGSNQESLVHIDLYHDHVQFTTASCNVSLQTQTNLPFTFGSWNSFMFVNEDVNNNLSSSLYLQYDASLSRVINSQRNVLQDWDIPSVPLDYLREIRLRINTAHPLNDIGTLTFTRDVATSVDRLQANFDLQNYTTSFYLRNQEISISTYDPADKTSKVSTISDTHNVVLGKNVIVRGTNNICLGNRFNTSGANSIILGNDIGTGLVEQGQLNDVYESIVIGNTSFRNSIVRDVICIGRNILNNLFSSPLDKVNAFLGQKPILIGNNIDKIDYDVNLGNTFLKTSIGGAQIYLGNTQEKVCIGYSSNESISSEEHLHVNGKAHISHGLVTPSMELRGTMQAGVGTVQVGMLVTLVQRISPTDYVFELPQGAQSKSVAGVITRINASHVFVATSGVVDVLVEPTTAVQPGDLLSSSATPGYANVSSSSSNVTITSDTVAKALLGGTNLVTCKLI